MHIICVKNKRSIWADAWFERFLTSGTYAGRHGQIVRLILRVHLVSAIVKSYCDLKEWEEAHFWGMRSINLMREQVDDGNTPHPNFPVQGKEAMGWIFARTAVAAAELGDLPNAKWLMSSARGWGIPTDLLADLESRVEI